MQSDDTPPASPAEPTERERLYEIAKAGGNWYAAAKPLPDEAFDALATPPASPAATDEEVARMVADLTARANRMDDLGSERAKLLHEAADLLARVAKERDEARASEAEKTRNWLKNNVEDLGRALTAENRAIAAEQRAEAAEKELKEKDTLLKLYKRSVERATTILGARP